MILHPEFFLASLAKCKQPDDIREYGLYVDTGISRSGREVDVYVTNSGYGLLYTWKETPFSLEALVERINGLSIDTEVILVDQEHRVAYLVKDDASGVGYSIRAVARAQVVR